MKVLLVDDHPLILAALQTVIQGLGDDVVVVAVDNAPDAHQALQHDTDFDLVLLDLQLGEVDGFGVLADMRQRYPALPVVVVSATERTSDVIRAIDMGAMGFVPKRASNSDLVGALAQVMAGGVYIPPMMLGLVTAGLGQQAAGDTVPSVMRTMGEHAQTTGSGAGGSPHSRSIESLGLTPRQTDVLALLLQGLPNKLIARELKVSVETVKDHVAAVLRSLDVSSRTQAVLAVSQMTQLNSGLASWKPSQR